MSSVYSQTSFSHISSSTLNAEGVEGFEVIEASQDFVEIITSSQFDWLRLDGTEPHLTNDNIYTNSKSESTQTYFQPI